MYFLHHWGGGAPPGFHSFKFATSAELGGKGEERGREALAPAEPHTCGTRGKRGPPEL